VAKYLLLWEEDTSRVAVDRKERGALRLAALEMVKRDLREGRTSDWGCFLDGNSGYAIMDTEEVDLTLSLQELYPYITWEVYPVLSVKQVEQVANTLAKEAS